MAMRSILTLALVVTTVAPLSGQEVVRRRERVDTLNLQRELVDTQRRFRVMVNGEDVSGTFGPLMQRRARLGVTVSLEPRASDSVGAYLESVTPGGPAANAGLQSGDVVIRLDGKSVFESGLRATQEQSVPGVGLIELAAKLSPNDTITVNYARGDARRSTSLVTGDEPISWTAEGNLMEMRFPGGERIFEFPGLRVQPRIEIERGPRVNVRRDNEWIGGVIREPGQWTVHLEGGALSDLELAPLNADLGGYFGTTEGVLVVKVPDESPLSLKAGDVILSVDGRKATSPSSVMRILQSYENGESLKLDVMRQKRQMTVTGTMKSSEWDVMRERQPEW